jgi:hypothetical protein
VANEIRQSGRAAVLEGERSGPTPQPLARKARCSTLYVLRCARYDAHGATCSAALRVKFEVMVVDPPSTRAFDGQERRH